MTNDKDLEKIKENVLNILLDKRIKQDKELGIIVDDIERGVIAKELIKEEHPETISLAITKAFEAKDEEFIKIKKPVSFKTWYGEKITIPSREEQIRQAEQDKCKKEIEKLERDYKALEKSLFPYDKMIKILDFREKSLEEDLKKGYPENIILSLMAHLNEIQNIREMMKFNKIPYMPTLIKKTEEYKQEWDLLMEMNKCPECTQIKGRLGICQEHHKKFQSLKSKLSGTEKGVNPSRKQVRSVEVRILPSEIPKKSKGVEK